MWLVILHSLNQQGNEDEVSVAMKLDIAKAYDHVEWSFLLAMMEAMGFPDEFRNRITECITTITYSVLINDASTGFIHPQRGLWQGDPMSLFLFFLYLLSIGGCSDRVIWHYSKNGDYMVRTGYGVAMVMQENGELGRKGTGSSSRWEDFDRGWREIWSLVLGIMAIIGRDFHETWKGLCMRFHENDTEDELLQECVFIMWRIWKSRNEMVFHKVLHDPMEMVHLVCKQLLEFRFCSSAANQESGHLGGGGGGDLFFNMAAMAEAAAIRAALLVCLELGYEEVEIESDSQVIIRVRFGFVKRNGNAAAHAVASYIASHGGAFRWDAIGLKFLFNVLAEDVNIPIRI
ncbi:hypothetical protein D8674_005908 [Pyrus ussuriensis x Pyrus communis]|uniref:Reverse transcriptase domain-containing protein n=1 Tax=Pyrus ussuriensis x Pyrus communis TaxID=2448454 RepID=A0A5N5FX62_9ROSA|nr:hypothetical protein D8674_005908 [Pyrus ussuriensis x Pyrus communis]